MLVVVGLSSRSLCLKISKLTLGRNVIRIRSLGSRLCFGMKGSGLMSTLDVHVKCREKIKRCRKSLAIRLHKHMLGK